MFNDQNLVENILDEDKERQHLEEMAKAKENKKMTTRDILQIILIVGLLIFIGVVTYLQGANLKAYIQWISDQTEYYVNNDSILSYLVFFSAQMAFHLLFVPGLTFFNVLVGFYMKNTLKAFLVIYLSSVVSCMITYYVARFLFTDYFEKTIFKKDIFNHMLNLSKASPWKASSMTRVLFIPVAYKNYGIALLRIDFVHYIVPAIIFYVPYLLFMVLVGASMSSIEQLSSNKSSWATMTDAEKAKMIFTLVLCFITVVIMIAFVVYTVIVFRRIRREIKDKKAADKQSTADNENETHN